MWRLSQVAMSSSKAVSTGGGADLGVYGEKSKGDSIHCILDRLSFRGWRQRGRYRRDIKAEVVERPSVWLVAEPWAQTRLLKALVLKVGPRQASVSIT